MPSKVLLLGEKVDDTLFLREALSPTAATGVSQSEFSCDVRLYGDLSNLKLSDYAAVFLVNPPPLANSAWGCACATLRRLAVVLASRLAVTRAKK